MVCTDQIDDQIDIARIERRLDALWEIGRTTDGGVTRTAYSREETEAHEYLCSELDSSYSVTVDAVGNVFATPFHDADRFVLTGSHLDSVYNAGRLDGALGVVASVEAVDAVHDVVDEPDVAPMLAIFRPRSPPGSATTRSAARQRSEYWIRRCSQQPTGTLAGVLAEFASAGTGSFQTH